MKKSVKWKLKCEKIQVLKSNKKARKIAITSGFDKQNKRKLAETEELLKQASDELTVAFKYASERRSEIVKFWTTTFMEESLSETENLRALYREVLGMSVPDDYVSKNESRSLNMKRGKFGHVSLAVLPSENSTGSRKQSASGSDQKMASLNESSNLRMSMPQLPPVETGDDITALMAKSLVSGSRTKLKDYQECPEEFQFHEYNIVNKKASLKSDEIDMNKEFELMNSERRKNPPAVIKEHVEKEEHPQMKSSWAFNAHSARDPFATHTLHNKHIQHQKEHKTDWHNFASHRSMPQMTPSAFTKDPSKLSGNYSKPVFPKPPEVGPSPFNTSKPSSNSISNSAVFQKHNLHNFVSGLPRPQARLDSQRTQPPQPPIELPKNQDFKFPDKHDFKHAPQSKNNGN